MYTNGINFAILEIRVYSVWYKRIEDIGMNGILQSPTSLEMMMSAMNAVTEGVVIVDRNSKIVYINDAYTRILDVKREKVLYRFMSKIEPDAIILQTIEDHQPRLNQLVEVKSRGKKVIVNISPFFKNGEFIGAISVFKDITAITIARNELKQAQQLSHSIFKAISQDEKKLPSEFSHIIGNDPSFIRCLRMAKVVAPTDATVLIEGESGVGKEIFVQAIRMVSGSRSQPFVSVNCSAIPESLIESELFGYSSGSFTGASKSGKVGKFEIAHGGTIFLDEIGEMPLFMQSKLLRVLQSGEIQKIGSNHIKRVDVRVIAATNRDLKKMVKDEKFREDLYFRLNTFKIVIPPLRKRQGDILMLANHFLERFSQKYHKKLSLSREVERAFLMNKWYGNVRQLESCIEYAVIVCNGPFIEIKDLPDDFHQVPDERNREKYEVPTIQNIYSSVDEELTSMSITEKSSLRNNIEQMEREQICQALRETNGNKTKAMKLLGISRRTFYKKYKKYNISQYLFTK